MCVCMYVYMYVYIYISVSMYTWMDRLIDTHIHRRAYMHIASRTCSGTTYKRIQYHADAIWHLEYHGDVGTSIAGMSTDKSL